MVIFIDKASLVARHLYKLHSRNLAQGIYDGAGGFVGIREKFGSRFLETELHRDAGGGTARAIEDLGPIPDFLNDIQISEVQEREEDKVRLFDFLDAKKKW